MKERIIQHYLGFVGHRDEYQEQKLNEVLAFAGIVTQYVIAILMLISLIWDIHQGQVSLGTIFLFLIMMGNSIYILAKTRKYRLTETEFYDRHDYQQAVRQLRQQMIRVGLLWTLGMMFWMEVVFPYLDGRPIEWHWAKALIYVIGGLAFATTAYLISKSKLRLVKR